MVNIQVLLMELSSFYHSRLLHLKLVSSFICLWYLVNHQKCCSWRVLFLYVMYFICYTLRVLWHANTFWLCMYVYFTKYIMPTTEFIWHKYFLNKGPTLHLEEAAYRILLVTTRCVRWFTEFWLVLAKVSATTSGTWNHLSMKGEVANEILGWFHVISQD